MEGNDIELTPVYKPHTTSTTTTTTTTTSVETNSSLTINQIVAAANDNINRQYSRDFLADFMLTQFKLNEHDAITIMETIAAYCDDDKKTDAIITALNKKNSFFETAFDFFIGKAQENIAKVTVNTIDTVTNPEVQQPTPTLNVLPLILKKIIMGKARQTFKTDYEIKLQGNPDHILSFDIHAPSGKAVITKQDDKTVRLYDLNVGGVCIIKSIPDKYHRNSVCFDESGNYIATSWEASCGYSVTEQWNISADNFTKNHSYKLDNQHIHLIAYYKKNSLLLMTCLPNPNTYPIYYSQIMITFKKNGDIVTKGSTKEHLITLHNRELNRPPYTATLDSVDKTLSIQKKCFELYLCKQAIKNVQRTQNLDSIIQSQTFKSLTTHEQHIVNKEMNTKRKALLQQ